LGRISLIALLLTAIALETFAQGNPSTFEFTENKGQWESKIKFKGELPAGDFYLHANGFTVVQHNTSDLQRFFHRQHGAVGDNAGSAQVRLLPGQTSQIKTTSTNLRDLAMTDLRIHPIPFVPMLTRLNS
jgi:hypothetical protein